MSGPRMPYSVVDAERLVRAYANKHGATWREDEPVLEQPTFWYFPVGYIGSCGVIVERSDLSLYPMGSGHLRGFSPDQVALRITEVFDLPAAAEFLLPFAGAPRGRNPNPRRAWTRTKLAQLPYVCPPQSLWLAIPAFRRLANSPSFQYEVRPTQ